jgi:DNA-binding beta-propeller fold protein YncE
MNIPRGIAVNQTTGNIYVADSSNNRVDEFNASGNFIRAWGQDVIIASGPPPNSNGTGFEICDTTAGNVASDCKAGITTPTTANGGMMSVPQGVAVDQTDGSVYVTDQGNRRIQKFTANGGFVWASGWDVETGGVTTFEVCTVAANCKTAAAAGADAGQFGAAIGQLAIGPGDNVFVADPANRRVQRFSPGGGFLSAFGWNVVPTGKPGDTPANALETCPASASSASGECQAGTAGAEPGQFSNNQPTRVAVDSGGAVYAVEATGNNRVQKFNPAATAASIFSPATLSGSPAPTDVAIDPNTDHVFVVKPCNATLCPNASVTNERRIQEFDNSGTLVDTHATNGGLSVVLGLGVNPTSGALYLSSITGGHRVYIVNTLPPPTATIEPVTTFSGTTATFSGKVNPTGFATGYHFEYRPDGSSSWTSAPATDADSGPINSENEVSQGVTGLGGSTLYHVRLVATKRYLGGEVASSVTSTETTFMTAAAPPTISGAGASQITASTATLNASVNPESQATGYRFEYGLADCSANPCTSVPAVNVGIGSGDADVAVAREISGLQPATTYHFRVVASNPTGTTKGEDRTFTTYPPSAPGLPDNRAYELVSLPDTNGFPPTATTFGEGFSGHAGISFATTLATANGDSVVYGIGGSLPGSEGNGVNDQYRAIRSSNGWTSKLTSPSGAQSELPHAGGISPDHRYAFWSTAGSSSFALDKGSLELGNSEGTRYVRGPDGSYELIGRGSLPAVDLGAGGRLITAGASHIIFTADTQLEPNAPESPGSGTDPTNFGESAVGAVYDRTPDGTTHVVSLLPGDVTPPPGSDTFYEGASADGSTIIFLVDTTMYVRRDNNTTIEVATDSPKFAGISQNGDRVFYVQGGDIFAFDTNTEVTTPIGSGGESTIVNVSADGSHVYFVSTQQLDDSNGSVGADNLYVWNGTTVRFIAILAPSDLERFDSDGLLNLGEWTNGVGPVRGTLVGPGRDPSRTTPDGEFFVFQSHASLTSYDSGGHSEVYRYDAGDQSLLCVSCSPISAPATSGAQLVLSALLDGHSPTGALSLIPNVTDDGETVFFQSADSLDPRDSNGTWDVYEWRAGRISLISSGHSSAPSYLYGMTPDGHDVFFTTREKLVPRDHTGSAGAIYDARIDGGFQEETVTQPCVEDACQGSSSPSPVLPGAGSAGFQGSGDPKPHRCSKGRRLVKQRGQTHCVRKHRHRADSKRGGAK